MPISVPRNEPEVAMPIARPAWPCLASAKPSSAGGGVGRRARDVEQDRRARAAVDRADVHADQHQDRLARRHLERERGQQRDAQRRREARQRADDDAERASPRARISADRGRSRGTTPGECPKAAQSARTSGQAHEEELLEHAGDDHGRGGIPHATATIASPRMAARRRPRAVGAAEHEDEGERRRGRCRARTASRVRPATTA